MPTSSAEGRKRRAYAPRVPAEERRAQLLDAALHLVAARGHTAVTMEAVAEQAGVTKPVVYGIYANRAELLDDLLQREAGQAMEQVMAALDLEPAAGPPDVGQALARTLDGFLSAVRATPDRWLCVVMPAPGMPAEFHAARDRARNVVLGRAEGLARGFLGALSAPPELDPEIVAHTLVALFESAARLVLTDPDRFHPERITAALRAAVGLALRRTADA